jgi:hypothetical protein
MERPKHAPGKWRKDSNGIRNDAGYIYLFPCYVRYENQEERYLREKAEHEATHNLVLAAPDMLQALKEFCKTYNERNVEFMIHEYEMASNAIEKAEGRNQK